MFQGWWMSVVDWVSVAEVLVVGEAAGDDEPIPGHRMTGQIPSLDIQRPNEAFAGSKDEALDTIDALVKRAINGMQPDEEVALGLSGGRDSRHLLLARHARGPANWRLLTAQHWNPAASLADLQGAKALADELRLDFDIVPSGRDRYAAEWEKNRRLGLRTLNHSWMLPMAARVPKGATLLDGLNGGNLLGRDSLTRSWVETHGTQAPSAGAALDHVIRRLVRAPRKRVKAWLVSPNVNETVWREVEERVEERFLRYVDFPNPFQAWSYLEHTRRGIALAPFVLMEASNVVCPYFDPDVVSFGLSLPWNISSQPTLQVDMLSRLYPQVAHVPYAHDFDRTDGRLDLDVEAEEVSWKRISPVLNGHVTENVINRTGASGHGWHGNRRVVLVAQALAWEERGAAASLDDL
jgi:hypothetical protein